MAEILISSAADDEIYLNGATEFRKEIRLRDVFMNGSLISYSYTMKWALDLVRQTSTLTCAATARTCFGYLTDGPSTTEGPVLITGIPADVDAIVGGRWTGTAFVTTDTSGNDLNPSTSKSTPSGVVKVFTSYQSHETSVAVALDKEVSILTSLGNRCYMVCTKAGTTDAAAPTVTDANVAAQATVADGANVDWQVMGYATLSHGGEQLEVVAENGYTKSEEIDHADWGKTNAAVSANFATAPDGETTADKLTANAGIDLNVFFNQVVTTPDNADYTDSFFSKHINNQWVGARFKNKAGVNIDVSFDILNGLVGVDDTGTARMILYPDGYYRCIYTVNSGAGATATSMNHYLQEGDDDKQFSNPLPDGTEAAIFWGMQFQPGVVADSYIKTDGTALTRLATNLSEDTTGKYATDNTSIDLVCTLSGAGQTGVIWGSYVDADNWTQIQITPTEVNFQKRVGGADVDLPFTFTHGTEPFRVLAQQLPVGSTKLPAGGMSLQVALVGASEPAAEDNANTTGLQIAATFEHFTDGNDANGVSGNLTSSLLNDKELSW